MRVPYSNYFYRVVFSECWFSGKCLFFDIAGPPVRWPKTRRAWQVLGKMFRVGVFGCYQDGLGHSLRVEVAKMSGSWGLAVLMV